jgi:hypothetical protein
MSIWEQFKEYLFLKKRDKSTPKNTYLKAMHGMNRISLLMFLIAIFILIFRYLILPVFR